VANATIRAAEKGLRLASKDRGVVESVWLLIRLPHAARAENYRDALYDLGLAVAAEPALMTLEAAFTAAVDACLHNSADRTDLSEMAQMAGAETIAKVLSDRTHGFLDTTPEDIRRELARLATVVQFGAFARVYFARLIFKVLDYFLSRTLTQNIGEGRRFPTLKRVAAFYEALETHCQEAAFVVQRFSGDWVSKTRYEHGAVTHDDAQDFVHGAMAKLIDELKRGAGFHGD
jgi:hypothetical protein